MKKFLFDALIIVLMGILLSCVIYFQYAELFMDFAMIPLVSAYFLGQYSQDKFGDSAD